MMDFITIPLVVGTITLGIYKLFELFVCKKERIAMIEKLADKLNTGEINSNLSLNLRIFEKWSADARNRTGSAGCLLHLYQRISGIYQLQKLGCGTSGKYRIWRMCTSLRRCGTTDSFPH